MPPAKSGAWACPHERDGQCLKVAGRGCDPGMKGCVLFGRFRFAAPAKNRPPGLAPPKKAAEPFEPERGMRYNPATGDKSGNSDNDDA